MWKDHNKELGSSKQRSIWILIKNKIDATGKPKTVKQIKTKIRNLKDAYKARKDNNKKTSRSSTSCSYFQDFDEIFGARDVVNFPHAREAGVTNQENVEQATENEGKWYLITVKFPRQVLQQIQITLEIIHPPPAHLFPPPPTHTPGDKPIQKCIRTQILGLSAELYW